MNKNKYKKPIYAIREDSNDSFSNNSESDGKEKQLWCICRSDDGSRFMICCDSCEEWYHGDCVNITPKQAESISKYFCTQCQKRNPTLKTQYKPGTVKKSKDTQFSSKFDKTFKAKTDEKLIDHHKIDKHIKPKHDDKHHDMSHSKFDKIYKNKLDEKPPEIDHQKYEKSIKSKFDERLNEAPLSKYDKPYKPKFDDKLVESTTIKNEKSLKTKLEERPFEPSQHKYEKSVKVKHDEKPSEPVIKFTPKPPKPGSCGECFGCLRKVDCNFCLHCRTKSDKGCLKRVCLLSRSTSNEKPAKPEKVMLTKLPGEFIPTKTAIPKKPRPNIPFTKTNAPSSESSSSMENQGKSLKRPLSPSSSECSSIISAKQKTNTATLHKLPTKKPKLEQDIVLEKPPKSKFTESSYSSDDNMDEDDDLDDDESSNDDSDESDDDDDDGNSSESFVLRKATKPANKTVQGRAKRKINEINGTRSPSPPLRKPRYTQKIEKPRMADCPKQYKPIECHNIGCNLPSRVGSKYCSDECGISLAEQRLLKYLPSRITNWNNSQSISNQHDRRTQAEIQEECDTIHHNLNILDKSHHDLIEFIDRWRSSCSASVTNDEEERRPAGANDDSFHCVTCGYLVASTKALAHMENCYQKIEGGTMVFADFEEQPIGSKLFCDYYDNNIRGYCKRLAALCDHSKDPKVDPKTICAFPLSVNEKSDKVCMTAKIKCNRHVNWERIQRAVIDMNRYRLLVRYEELQVEDRKFKHNIAQRGGVMSLLLHDTIDHQPLKPLLPFRNVDRNKMRKFTKAKCI